MHHLIPHRRGRTTAALATLGLVGGLLLSTACDTAPRPRPEPPSPAPGHERIFSVTPSSAAEQTRLGTDFPVADAQPTGLYLPPGASLAVRSGRAAGAPVPVLLVGTYGLDEDDKAPERMPREYPLKPGGTTVKDPRGGMLYVRYTSDDSTVESGDVTVRFGAAARPVPYHVLGSTPGREWRARLAEAGDVPVAQFVSEHVVLTVHLDSARRNAGQDPDALMRAYEHILAVEDRESGLDGKDPRDRRSPLRYFISEGRPGNNPNAYLYRVCYPGDAIDSDVLDVERLKNESWGMWHELGHLHQQSSWNWGGVDEATVNIYSLAVQRDAGAPSRLGEDGTPEDVREFLAGRAKERTFDALAEEKPFVQLAMFEQLRLAYGDDFYPRLHREARRSESGMDPNQFFIVQASKTAGQDLTEFFGAWRLTISDEARAEVAELGLPAPERDLTALDIAP